jgi:hypothetical protein
MYSDVRSRGLVPPPVAKQLPTAEAMHQAYAAASLLTSASAAAAGAYNTDTTQADTATSAHAVLQQPH